MTYEELPQHWQREIKQLRADCAKYRTRAKQARAAERQLEAIRAVLGITTEETR